MRCENCGSLIPNGINCCYICKNNSNISNEKNLQQQKFISTFDETISKEERNLADKQLRSASSVLVFSTVLSFVLPIVSLIIIKLSMCKIKSLCTISALDISYKAKKIKNRATISNILAWLILFLQIFFFAVCIILHFSIQYIPALYNFALEHKEIFSIFLFLI